MSTASQTRRDAPFPMTPATIALCVFLAIAAFFLWEEHQAHVLGILPYLLLAACPVIHLFMHHGHRHGGHEHDDHGETGDRS